VGRLSRRVVATCVLGASLVALATPPPASALIVYTLVATPLTVTADVVTEFSMTLTNVAGPDDLGCAEVDLPAEYEIYSVSDPVASNNRNWTAVVTDNNVLVHANNGGGRLRILQSVTFTITARPKQAELGSWSNHAHRDQDCDDAEQVGLPILVTVLPPILPTPTPTPTATPTPTPRPLPSLTPLPSLPALPTPVPTARPTPEPTARPGVVLPVAPSVSPSATPTPEPAESPSASPRPTTTPMATSSPGAPATPGGGGTPIQLATTDPGGGGALSLATLDVFSGATVFAVPAAALGGPGVLILLWVLLQTLGAATWIPAVRRLRGKDPHEAA
jgi:hypothetical protein